MNEEPINCNQVAERLTDGLINHLPDAERTALEAHLKNCPTCAAELASTQRLWQLMGDLPAPAPDPTARIRFQAMLDTYKETVISDQKSVWSNWLTTFWQRWASDSLFRLAYSLGLLAIGLAAGYGLHRSSSPEMAYQMQVDTLSKQVQEMRQMVMLSLLENPVASERLRAVSYTEAINQVDQKVLDALLTTLNNDANVNVRLVTLEALAKLADNPTVREGLVQSIAQQESPLVQSALADVMVKLQEKRSIKPLRKLLQSDNLNHLVKGKIEQSIRELS